MKHVHGDAIAEAQNRNFRPYSAQEMDYFLMLGTLLLIFYAGERALTISTHLQKGIL